MDQNKRQTSEATPSTVAVSRAHEQRLKVSQEWRYKNYLFTLLKWTFLSADGLTGYKLCCGVYHFQVGYDGFNKH